MVYFEGICCMDIADGVLPLKCQQVRIEENWKEENVL